MTLIQKKVVNRVESTCNRANFPLQFRLIKWSFFFIQTTMRSAQYLHPRLDSILELCGTFPIALVCDNCLAVGLFLFILLIGVPIPFVFATWIK